MSPAQTLREVLWHAAELVRRDAKAALPRLITMVGLKVLTDSAGWFRQQGYRLPEQALWGALKRAPRLSQAVMEAMQVLAAENVPLRFLQEGDPTWFDREDVIGQLLLLLDSLDLRMENPEDWGEFGCHVDLAMSNVQSRWTWAEQTTPPIVNKLLAALLAREPLTEGSVYDPVCGIGGTLVAIEASGVQRTTLTYYGQDVSLFTLYMCTWNLLLHGIARFQLAHGDIFTEPRFLSPDGTRVKVFDRVVADPPWGLMREVEWGPDPYQRFRYGALKGRRADYGFVQHVLASLHTNGIGMLVLPAGVLARSGFEHDIRRNLVQADVIDAIVTLPERTFAHTTLPAALMIFCLQKPADRRRGVRMVDATGTGEERRRELNDALVARIARAVSGSKPEPGFARTVPLEDLAAHDFSLVPEMYVTAPVETASPAEMAQHVQKAEDEYAEAHRVLAAELARLAAQLNKTTE